jgi:6-phosphogluconolactonase
LNSVSPSSGLIEQHYADGASAVAALVAEVTACLRAALAARGVASLIVSGGKSPIAFFNALSRQNLDWTNVWISLADERWLEPTSADSNAHLVREHLWVAEAAAAHFVPLKSPAATPQTGLAASTALLAAIPQPFDVVVLGMGEDGHTASLFPGADGLAAALDANNPVPLVAIDPPSAPYPRISMTLSALLNSRQLFLPLHGASKRAVYRNAAQETSGARYPITAFLHQKTTPLTVLLSD